jgi:hypothetical protein
MSLDRGDRNIHWIEKYCRVPNGAHQGKPVRLSTAERVVMRKLYDAPGGPRDDVPVPKPLSAFYRLAASLWTKSGLATWLSCVQGRGS